jgi:hypothetical protein
MPLRPCSACEQRTRDPLSSLYWAWNDDSGHRHAYKQWLCVTCFCMRVLPLIKGPDDELLSCPVCHELVAESFEAVYCKIYCPGQPPNSQEWACCPAHGAELRLMAGLGAEALPDRQNGNAGSAPNLSATAVWDALGLRPRE